MFEKNQIITAEIESFASDGRGVCRVNNFAFFAPLALPGEIVTARVIKLYKTYGICKVLSVKEPSPARAAPPCPVFPRCGGCALQHMKYGAQLDFKFQKTREALLKIGGVNAEDIGGGKCLPSENALRYRNKAIIPFGRANGEPAFGFYARRSHAIVPFDDCLLCPAEFSRAVAFTRDYLLNAKTDFNILKHVLLRKSFQSGETLFCAVVNARGAAEIKKTLGGLFRALAREGGASVLAVNLSPSATNVCLSGETRVISKRDCVSERICGLNIKIGVNTFFQINVSQAEKLFFKAASYAKGERNALCADLFCGVGALSLVLARFFEKVIGVEISPQSVENAVKNAKDNGLGNVVFFCRDANEFLASGEKPDCVVADPPRKGLGEGLINALLSARVARVVYISCNPATLARDIALLSAAYELADCAVFDCFPQTEHVECVCLLTRRQRPQSPADFREK